MTLDVFKLEKKMKIQIREASMLIRKLGEGSFSFLI